MSMNTTISLSVKPRQTLTAPYEGRGVANFAYGAEWTSGTADDQADLCTQSVKAIAGSGNSDIDLRAELTPANVAASGAELAGLIIEVPDTASGNITLKDSAANGLGLFSGTTDGMVLPAGTRLVLLWPEDGSVPMSASAKSINLANAGGSATNVTVTTLQRSA